ncbi:fumarylacetoacetate hydrolase family protein [Ramlibacter sp. AW1]|jgi:2-oxo-3-hexenedioate decarboxylase|uniref:Fumarylacetoacetate hydrolase family protein n=1 Tax=Ramlibacter aurantiacus TaxID=2801330 RepID=A0A937D6L2_9BURK|nr:fumarylacetoacetate hydrolase family protein [Ramlibacter aurantiacus]MBL0422422.1 fumarylacetoacetate hydrolase family protein [Ramlibacter aurantiacus]
MNQERISLLAQRLDDAALYGRAIPQFAEAEGLSMQDAYAVQATAIARRLQRGEHRTGVKMGLTSRAKMVQVGVHDVIWGRLTDAMAEADGAPLSLGRFVHPRVEPELAFLLRQPLPAKPSMAEALEAVAAIAPALEIIDSRFENFKFSLGDVIADNASSSGYVIGPWHAPGQDFSNLGLVLSIDGVARQVGSTAGILGNPLRSLVSAAVMSAAAGEPLQAGWIVMAGGATAAEPLNPGQHVLLEMQCLGRVEFNTTV